MRNTVAVAILAASLSGHAGNLAWAQSPAPAAPPQTAAVPSTIPLFPLPDVVLFPDVALPLRIFEPRYRAMVADALKGIASSVWSCCSRGTRGIRRTSADLPVGCAGVITEWSSSPTVSTTLVLRGLQKFRVMSEDPGGAYRVAHITLLPEPHQTRRRQRHPTERQRVQSLLNRLGIEPPLRPSPTRASSSAWRRSWSSLRSSGKNARARRRAGAASVLADRLEALTRRRQPGRAMATAGTTQAQTSSAGTALH